MSVQFALERISRHMEELGNKNGYMVKFKHYSLHANETRIVKAYSEFLYLVESDIEISASSEFGTYNLLDDTINEQQYEHQGKITLINSANTTKQIKFIQVIPKHI